MRVCGPGVWWDVEVCMQHKSPFNCSQRTMINAIGLIVHEEEKTSDWEGSVSFACG